MKVKPALALIFLIFGFSVVFAQTDHNKGLVLRGTYSEWEKKIARKYNFYVGDRPNPEYLRWTAKLRMEFVNRGKEKILLIAPNQEFGKFQSKVYFSARLLEDSGNYRNKNLVQDSYQKELRKYYSWGFSARDLISDEPPQNTVYILEPGESMFFYDSLVIWQEFKKKEIKGEKNKTSKPPKDEKNFTIEPDGLPFSSYQEIKVKYEISFLKSVEDVDFLEKVQHRWRKFGYLPVDSEGIFSITSEVLSKG